MRSGAGPAFGGGGSGVYFGCEPSGIGVTIQ